ncbi:hypothetical protein [Cohnella sp. GCM10027633]|uniref:hypothetical protein n=1 Tax=unclassified Cohnella TaxID=2636738 RepID=UPI00362A9EAF
MNLSPDDDKPIREALFQFIFPFSLARHAQNKLIPQLTAAGFEPFRLDHLELENRYYGDHFVSHHRMERYYLPFTGQVLFPAAGHPDAFRRLSKSLDGMNADLVVANGSYPFTVHSADVVLCPYDTGFVTLRVELKPHGLTLTDAIEFADRMRAMENISTADHCASIRYLGQRYEETEDLLFRVIVPELLPCLDRMPMEGTYFEKLPFLMDERMFVIGFYAVPENAEIGLEDRYRVARLDGLGQDGLPHLDANHRPYIEEYCRRYGYDRWAPDTYYITDEDCFCCLTRLDAQRSSRLASLMYGEHYYGLLLNLFHRIVLLKLSYAYSRVQIERKPDETEALIGDITSFSAKYYFLEAVAQTNGRELFYRLRSAYGNDELFEDVKQTLTDLYKYQDDRTSKRSSHLLTILTIYSVISGIYGMNQVIEDLEAPVRWQAMDGYSAFQWIALGVVLSGLVVSAALAAGILWRTVADYARRK